MSKKIAFILLYLIAFASFSQNYNEVFKYQSYYDIDLVTQKATLSSKYDTPMRIEFSGMWMYIYAPTYKTTYKILDSKRYKKAGYTYYRVQNFQNNSQSTVWVYSDKVICRTSDTSQVIFHN